MKKYTSKRGRSCDIRVDPREVKEPNGAAGHRYAVAVRTTGADPGNRRWLRLKDGAGKRSTRGRRTPSRPAATTSRPTKTKSRNAPSAGGRGLHVGPTR